MQRRLRTVKLDNLSATVAPLSFDQAQDFSVKYQRLAARQASEEEIAALTIQAVADGLNNALSAAEFRDWNVGRVRSEFDAGFISALSNTIFEMSGLAVQTGVAA
jgi:hypothetical protein